MIGVDQSHQAKELLAAKLVEIVLMELTQPQAIGPGDHRDQCFALPPERANERTGALRETVDQAANLSQPRAKLGVADLNRHQ